MLGVVVLTIVTANFTAYPSYGDKGIATPRGAERHPRVEASIDRGPITELIVRCPTGTAIISYSKVERRFCTPRLVCHRDLGRVVAQSCGG
jgi:hypothetical protein